MYICSFLLFCSSLTILYIGVKNCRKSNNINNYFEICKILQHDPTDDFVEHYEYQTFLNDELKKKYC